MYLFLLAAAAAVLAGTAAAVLGAGWLGCVALGIVVFVVVWIVAARRLGRRLTPAIEQVQRQIAAGSVKQALDGLAKLLPMAKWMPLLEGQLRGQMGFLHYQSGNKAAALDCLARTGRRAGDAKLLLACMRYQAGDKAAAFTELARALPFNRRHALLHNTYAWLLNREKRRDEAIAVLGQYLRKSDDAPSKDNRLRLQNGQRMKMEPFGMTWYALGFERPPASMGQLRTARKGFRQPPKRTG